MYELLCLPDVILRISNHSVEYHLLLPLEPLAKVQLGRLGVVVLKGFRSEEGVVSPCLLFSPSLREGLGVTVTGLMCRVVPEEESSSLTSSIETCWALSSIWPGSARWLVRLVNKKGMRPRSLLSLSFAFIFMNFAGLNWGS